MLPGGRAYTQHPGTWGGDTPRLSLREMLVFYEGNIIGTDSRPSVSVQRRPECGENKLSNLFL